MEHTRLVAAIGAAAIAAAGLGAGAAITACGSSAQAPAAAATPGGSSYSYYRSMMGRLRGGGSPGSMMGGTSYGWMMGGTGYRWMMGGLAAPAWMRGHALPGFMMGTIRDPGKIMGRLWANAPGPRVSPGQATALGSQVPAGGARSAWMPMMTARPAFTGSALWFLGNPTAAGMHAGTISFTASMPGTYRYLCPVPGHAQKGMTGSFTVSSTT